MSASDSLDFVSSPDADPAELAAKLEQALGLRGAGIASLRLAYYDSFDWRLTRAGWEFVAETLDGRSAIFFGRSGEERGEPLILAEPPRFAADFPEGKWRNRAEELLETRALLPRLELRGERHAFVIEDGEGGAALHLDLENLAVLDGEDPIALPPRVRLTPFKGFRKHFRQTQDRLVAEFGLEPAEELQPSAGLALLGRAPDDPSALRACRLDLELRADAAAKQVLRNLLECLGANEAGIKCEIDTEFLHDFRVAVRRTRSALSQIKQVFPDRVVQRFAKGFAELGRATSEARDLDVYLLDFDRYAEGLAEPLRAGLEPLREFLRVRAAAAHTQLNRYLESAAYRRLMASWSEFLAAPAPQRPRAEKALVPIGEVADRRIWKLYRRVLNEGGAIGTNDPPERLHDLRKTCKKLRYLMELFRGLYPAVRIGPLVKILKSLQDHLGEYQDAHVQITELRRFAEDLRAGGAPTDTLLALGALLDGLHKREQNLRAGFEARFAEFAEDSHQRRFRQLFKPTETARNET